MAVRVAINGAGGRMGRRLMALTVENDALELTQALERQGYPLLGMPVREVESEVILSDTLTDNADVLIDFTVPASTVARCKEAADLGIALIIGTTGMTEEEEVAVAEAAKTVPVIHAGNFSLGINLLVNIAGEVAKALGEEFDIEIVESHHNQKADAPSGTALMIAESICHATGRDIKNDLVYGRQGRPGPRTRREIGMHAIRMGSVVGEHTAHFGSDAEIVELTHRAANRDVFAAGALRAAAWIVGKDPGMYTMNQVLFE